MEFTTIRTDELTELLNYRREYFKICDLFSIPVQQRTNPDTAKNIIERIHTYQSGYILRRSLAERDNKAAFHPSPPTPLSDPEPNT